MKASARAATPARRERRPGSAIAREERLQRASFLELRDRHAATQSLLKRIREQRESVVEMVKQAQTQQARQQRQLEYQQQQAERPGLLLEIVHAGVEAGEERAEKVVVVVLKKQGQ